MRPNRQRNEGQAQKKTSRFKFNKAAIDALPTPTKRTYYRDTKETRLGICVFPTGKKSFFVAATVNGQSRRISIGKYPHCSIPLARKKALETTLEVAKGNNPIEKKRAVKTLSLSLNDVLEDYFAERTLKPLTMIDYRNALRETFCLDHLMRDITEDYVRKAYLERGKSSKARADNAVRVLKALFNYARVRYKKPNRTSYFPNNPTDLLNDAKIRYRIERRRTIIKEADLAEWWSRVHQLTNPISRDYLLFLLLSGCRKTEAAKLQWKDIDLKSGTFHLNDTKNKRPIDLPLPETIAKYIKDRQPGTKGTDWLFPSGDSYLKHPNKSIAFISKSVKFTPHDLRRTYTTLANGLDISVYTVKALLNHKVQNADVTAGYDIPDMRRLRAASQKIETHILGLVNPSVVSLKIA